MKQLLYLIPLLLIGLSFTPVTLYKDKVDFLIAKNPDAQFDDLASAFSTLSPSHWKILDYSTSTNASFNLTSAEGSQDLVPLEEGEESQVPETPKQEPVHEGATFRGFPFAAYLSKDSTTDSAIASTSTSISSYSWLWLGVDASLVIVSLIVVFKLNRKKHKTTQTVQADAQTPAQSTTIQPGNSDGAPVSGNQDPGGGVHPQVIMPTKQPEAASQPPQQPQAPHDSLPNSEPPLPPQQPQV